MRHDVTFTVPERPLERVDIEFDVRGDGAMLGTLKVSRGDLEWRPRDDKYGYHMTWSKLDAVMKQGGTKRPR